MDFQSIITDPRTATALLPVVVVLMWLAFFRNAKDKKHKEKSSKTNDL